MATIQAFFSIIVEFINNMMDPTQPAFSLLISTLLIILTIVVTIRVPVGRTPFILVFALLVFTLSTQMEGLNYDFFSNLSTELVAAVLAIFIMPAGLVRVRWALPPVAIGVLTIPFLLLAMGIPDELVLNLRTDLLGGFLVFILMNRPWLVHYRRRPSARHQARKARSTAAQHTKKKERVSALERDLIIRLRRAPQYDMAVMVRGTDPDDVHFKANRVEILNNVSFRDAYFTRRREMGPLCIMMASLPPAGAPQITLILEGQPGPVQHALTTCHDVFEVIDNHHEPGSGIAHARLTIQPPRKPFNRALYEQLARALSQHYREHRAQIHRMPDYEDGFDDGYRQAVIDLRQILVPKPTNERTTS